MWTNPFAYNSVGRNMASKTPKKKSLKKAVEKPPAPYRRADSPKQKDERRRAILAAAAAQLARPDAGNFTIENLAGQLGLAKGTVYLYFPSKNILFLALLGEALESLMGEIREKLLRLPSPVGARDVARIFREAMVKSSQLRQLPRLLRSLSGEGQTTEYEEFHERTYALKEQVDAALVGRLGALRPGDGRDLMGYAWALHLGFSEMAENRRHKKKLCEKMDEKKTIWTDPGQSLEDSLTLLIEGYLSRKS